MILGLDIGGANLKAATSDGRAVSVPFALWKQPERLAAAVVELVARFSGVDELAITMTGELCDCFETKRDGVRQIVKAAMAASRNLPTRFWSTDGVLLDAESATRNYISVAAANWHALATFIGYEMRIRRGLLIDMGSTTTDLIPISDQKAAAIGLTDFDRLTHGELVYTGLRRTPATTLLGPDAAAEFFATVLDAHLLLGTIPEDPADTDTADGRPATQRYAHGRLSRMIGGDPELTSTRETLILANSIMNRQRSLVFNRIEAIRNRFETESPTAILAGSGERFLRSILAADRFAEVVSLNERLGSEISASAPAYAVARLAKDRPV
jgi:probable H4MPT-linked C1 transfer pathway protein